MVASTFLQSAPSHLIVHPAGPFLSGRNASANWDGSQGVLMESVNIRRIRCGQANAAEKLAELRHQLSSQADVVSERGRHLTQAVFGEPLPPTQVVERICADLQS